MTTLLPSRVSRALEPWSGRDPFHEMRAEMDDLLTRFFGNGGYEWPAARQYVPALDLAETDDALQLRMDVPGFKPDDINIEVTGNTLRISGERKEEREEKGRTYHRVERAAGSFCRTLTLPCAVQEKKIEAEDAAGVLTITLSKAEEAKTRKIPVKPK